MFRRTLIVLFASVLALSACGSDGGGDDVSSDPAADRAEVKASVKAFEAQARADHFTVDPDDGEDDSDLEFDSAECKKLEEAFGHDKLPGETANADSDSFTRGELDVEGSTQESLEGSAAKVGDANDLDEVFALFQDERMERCMTEALQAEFADSADGEEVQVNDLDVEVQDVEGVGDEATQLHITASLDISVVKFPFVVDLALARKDRAAALVVASTIGGPKVKVDVPALLSTLLGEDEPAA